MRLKPTLVLVLLIGGALVAQAQYNAVYSTNGTLLKPTNPKIPGSLTVTGSISGGRIIGPVSGTNIDAGTIDATKLTPGLQAQLGGTNAHDLSVAGTLRADSLTVTNTATVGTLNVTTITGAGTNALFQAATNAAKVYADSLHTGKWLRLRSQAEYWTDFLEYITASSPGKAGLVYVANSGSSVQVAGEAGIPGILTLSTGTSDSSAPMVTMAVNSYPFTFGSGAATNVFAVRIPTLTTEAEAFILRIGAGASLTSSDGADAVYFRLSSASANWIAVTREDTAETTADTGITAQANTWYELAFISNANASSVEFFINGTSVGSITTNIPDTNDVLSPFAQIVKTAGTTFRTLNIDRFYFGYGLTTSR